MSDSLSTLLRTWRHQPSDAPDFNAAVWARIRAQERAASMPLAVVRSFRWTLPLAAGFTVIASVAFGVGAGLAVSRSQTADRMAAAYARSIDPILMSGSDARLHP